MSTACGRPQGGLAHVGWGVKIRFFCGCHKWMAPNLLYLCPRPRCHAWSWAHFLSPYKFGCTKCYYQLRQLWVVSCSLTHQSIIALVHTFVTTKPYWLLQFSAGWAPWYFGPVRQSSAARLLGRWPKFSSITAYMCDVLHWLPISQWINIVLMGWCPGVSFTVSPLTFVTSAAQCQLLRSAARGELLVPRARLATVLRRAFSVVGPSASNDLPVELRSLLMARPSKVYISLKSFFFGRDD